MPPFPTIPLLHAAYAAGLDPRAVVAEAYRRLAAVDDPGIFLALVPEAEAQADAAALPRFDPQAMPLWGVPFAVKDNIDVAGLPTTAACPAFAYTPERTATVVERLRAAGAILIGKTNLDQFATGLVGVRSPYPACRATRFDPTLRAGRLQRPARRSRSPPGSSPSRSAPIRRDRAGCRRRSTTSSGLKPTLGRGLRRAACVPACRTLDMRLGVRAARSTTPDAAFRAMRGLDAADPYSRADAGRRRSPAARRPALRRAGCRRACEFFGDALRKRRLRRATRADLEALARRIVDDRLRAVLRRRGAALRGPWVAERYAAIRPFIETRPGSLHPVTRAIIEQRDRLHRRRRLRGLYGWRNCGAPPSRSGDASTSSSCRPAATAYPAPSSRPIRSGSTRKLGTYTNFVNLLDLCALAVPAGSAHDGLPAGVTLIAPARAATALLASLGAPLQPRPAAARRRPCGRCRPPPARPRPCRRDRDRGRRRASVGPAAEPRTDRARRAVPAHGDDPAGLSPLRAPGRAAAAPGAAARRRAAAVPSRRRSGRCRPPPSAPSWPASRRRSASARLRLADGTAAEGLPGRGGRRRGRGRHHAVRWLARLHGRSCRGLAGPSLARAFCT